jgi:primosomal protein N' (replication factor Y)
MRDELFRGNKSIFSVDLEQALEECFESGNQAILFINRRGYATFVSCRACGYVMQCPDCDVSLTYHKYENVGKCHYCGMQVRIPDKCPECASPYIKFFGAGTEQVEEGFKKLFPGRRSLRMDADTTSGKDAHEKLLSRFAGGEADVLIGTQMVAKGLDFPNVALVGVMAADASLYIPDYRATERTFQLITQVAGRSGRDEAIGRVLVQTYSPAHPAVVYAAQQEYKAFYDFEIRQREKAEFPPFSVFARALITGDEPAPLERASTELAQELERLIRGIDGNLLIHIAASPAPVRRLAQKHRYQVILKLRMGGKTDEIVRAVYACVRAKQPEERYHLEINPQNML